MNQKKVVTELSAKLLPNMMKKKSNENFDNEAMKYFNELDKYANLYLKMYDKCKKGEEFYNLYTNNCADIVKDIFEKGTGTKLEMGVSPIPNKNFSTITDNKEDIQKALNDKLDDEHKK